jgi:hypothetical protein
MLTSLALGAMIVIMLWGLPAMGKLLQTLSAMNRTLQEIGLAIQDSPRQV